MGLPIASTKQCNLQGTEALSRDDALTASLVQTTGPAHIPLSDQRWQELFLHYNRLVHLEYSSESDDDILAQSCKSMAKHAEQSSNLASLCLHVSRMVRDMETTIGNKEKPSKAENKNSIPSSASSRIALVGKARATCGALNLLRILVHRILLTAATDPELDSEGQQNYLTAVFTYRSREGSHSSRKERRNGKSGTRDAGLEIFTSLMSFISLIGKPISKYDSSKGNNNNIGLEGIQILKKIPEIYDITMLVLSLLLVMFSSQLYQPMISSCQHMEESQNTYNGNTNNYFLDLAMKEAKAIHQKQKLSRQRESPIHTQNLMEGLSSGTEGYSVQSPQSTTSSISKKCHGKKSQRWSSSSVLLSLLNFMMERPESPSRSISAHHVDLANMVVRDVKREKPGPDGIYENHTIVMAAAPKPQHVDTDNDSGPSSETTNSRGMSKYNSDPIERRSAPKIFIDATNKVIHISSSIVLLPFRLMTLALALLTQQQKLLGFRISGMPGNTKFKHNEDKLLVLQSMVGGGSAGSCTSDVLWLTESPVSDLANALFLVLINNHRVTPESETEDSTEPWNPFRYDMVALDDNRWEELKHSDDNLGKASNDINELFSSSMDSMQFNEGLERSGIEDIDRRNLPQPSALVNDYSSNLPQMEVKVNFENLFQSFGQVLHNEVGALTLYSLLQASPKFAEYLAVRSDLDTIMMPLLRALYFSCSSTFHSTRASSAPSKSKINGSNVIPYSLGHPFRSISHLYVILILLLMFSQDQSFGPVSFRRVTIPVISWYKERHLKEISLGSVIVLTLLRAITFNLNRLDDYFLLNNSCAVLLNLSPHVVKLHPYAAMRLATMTVTCMRRYSSLVVKNDGHPAGEDDTYTTLGMYAEVMRYIQIYSSKLHISSLIYLLSSPPSPGLSNTSPNGEFCHQTQNN